MDPNGRAFNLGCYFAITIYYLRPACFKYLVSKFSLFLLINDWPDESAKLAGFCITHQIWIGNARARTFNLFISGPPGLAFLSQNGLTGHGRRGSESLCITYCISYDSSSCSQQVFWSVYSLFFLKVAAQKKCRNARFLKVEISMVRFFFRCLLSGQKLLSSGFA